MRYLGLIHGLTLALLTATACGTKNDDGSDGTGGDGTTTGDGGGGSGGSGTTGGGATGGGGSGTDATVTDGTGVTGTGPTGGNTGTMACTGLAQAACEAAPNCVTIDGRPFVSQGDGWCLGEAEVLGCMADAGCGDAITHACEEEGADPYWFADTCIPDGWITCEPPTTEDIGTCE